MSMPSRRALAIARAFGASLAAVAGSACDYNDVDPAQQILPPVTTREALVWADRSTNELLFVRPSADDLDVERVSVGDERTQIAWTTATRDRAHVLALATPATAKQEDAGHQLYRFPGDGTDDSTIYDVRAPFSQVALSPDHRRAVLFFGGASSEQLHNANQVAIVDLASTAVANLTLNGFGGLLQTVEFPGQIIEGQPTPVQVGGVERDIAAFLAASEVVLVDLADPEFDQVAIPLGPEIGFSPVTTLLRPGNALYAAPVVFVRSSQGAEVGMLTLLPEATTAGFTAQISLIPVGQSSTDFVVHDTNTAPYLITSDATAGALVFTDIRTQGGFAVTLATAASRLLLRDGETGRQVVAWAPGSTQISVLDLSNLEDSLSRKPEVLKIETGIQTLVQLDNDRLLIGSGAQLYIVDLPVRQVTPLSAQTPYDATASALVGDRLLLGTTNQPWVSSVDLRTQTPASMILDHSILSFHYLPGPNQIVVTHNEPAGLVTVINPDAPSRATSRVFWGVLLHGILDRE